MELRKCTQCSGNLKRLRTQRMWVCPFCGARYEDAKDEKKKEEENTFGLNEEVFEVTKDLTKLLKKDPFKGFIKSVIQCMEKYETAAEVEAYMLKKLSFSDDISAKGVREEEIEKALPKIQSVLDPDERVIVYQNKGIFSKGKEFCVVTDQRCVFAAKNKVKDVLHTDIESLKIEDSPNVYLNGNYDQGIINLDANGKFQGALIAYICMRSFEEDPDRDRIEIG